MTTLNLVAVYFTQSQYERAQSALENAAVLHPSRLVVLEGATGAVKRDIQLPVGRDQGGIDASARSVGP